MKDPDADMEFDEIDEMGNFRTKDARTRDYMSAMFGEKSRERCEGVYIVAETSPSDNQAPKFLENVEVLPKRSGLLSDGVRWGTVTEQAMAQAAPNSLPESEISHHEEEGFGEDFVLYIPK